MAKEKSMLSTKDNPYSPFTQYEEWESFDRIMGYNTPAYLARVAITSDELSDEDQEASIGEAIDSIISLDLLGIYIEVVPEDFPSEEIK